MVFYCNVLYCGSLATPKEEAGRRKNKDFPDE